LAWVIEWDDKAVKEFQLSDPAAQRSIIRYLNDRIATDKDLCRFGEPLRKDLKGFWKYRVGDYRLICPIEANKLIVLVVRVGHRRNVNN
jgi:mRNA interferase RelE/StbE